jgi:GTPase
MWAHLASNRMGGGVGSRFGEGESQLEVDRRMVRKRITSIKRELKHLESVRALQRESRYGSSVFNVALAGYTNAGKSSLLNKLTDADVLSYDKLFATLDSTTRRYKLPEGREITVTDTVGFIRKLPTTLIEAFKSTLDEINGSDLIIHVIDASSDERAYQIEAVETVLGQIGAETIPRIEVFNKCDLLDEQTINAYRKRYPQALFISALNGSGFGDLITAITSTAASQDTLMNVVIPYKDSAMTALAHKRCNIVSESYEQEGTALTLYVAHNLVGRFEPYIQT